MKTVKVDVISGFLGAGKTTLIKKLLGGAFGTEKVVLIENEFGEIGVDGAFLRDSGIAIKEINAGCICCSLVGNFRASMKSLIATYAPDRILIEPSGVGKLSDIVVAIENVDEPLRVNVLATVVDGLKGAMYLRNFGEFFTNQVASASVIILSKTDKMTPDAIDAMVALIRTINPTAPITSTPLSSFTPQELLALLEKKTGLASELHELLMKEHAEVVANEEREEAEHAHEHDHEHGTHESHEEDEGDVHEEHHHEHHHDGEHDADEVFDNLGIETAQLITREELETFLTYLAQAQDIGVVLRSKGVLPTASGDWLYFDYVNGDWEIRTGKPDLGGRLCVIGSGLDTKAIEAMFLKGCRRA